MNYSDRRPRKSEPDRMIPSHNLYGDHGPRCPRCSGLGRVLGLIPGMRVTNTSVCICKGTGVDPEHIERLRWEAVTSRLDQMELIIAKERQQRQRLEAQLAKFKARSPKLSRQYWEECIAWVTADGATISATTTETIIFPNITIPANFMQDGRNIRFQSYGRHTSAGQTCILRMRWGGVAGTVIMASPTVTAPTATAGIWKHEGEIQTRSNGSSGTLFGINDIIICDDAAHSAGSATSVPALGLGGSGGVATPSTATCDLTADTALAMTMTFGTAGSNSCIGHVYTLEALN